MPAPAFGSQPGDFGNSGIPVPQPPDTGQFIDDIHRIEQKYVEGQTNFRLPLQLTTNGGKTQDMTGQVMNAIILTVTSGVIFGYLFDNSSLFGSAATAPDFCCSAGVVPTTVEVMIPQRDDYRVSFQEGAAAAGGATGVARLVKL